MYLPPPSRVCVCALFPLHFLHIQSKRMCWNLTLARDMAKVVHMSLGQPSSLVLAFEIELHLPNILKLYNCLPEKFCTELF